MKRVVMTALLVAAGLCVALGAASAQHARRHGSRMSGRGATSTLDRQFVAAVAMAGTAEVQLSKLALKRSGNKQVKYFARTMIHDHTQAGRRLAQVAAREGVRAPMMLDPQHRAVKSKLSHLSGSAFNQAYMSAMIDDHSKAVSLFENEIAHGKNPAITNFASNTLSTVSGHLQMAHDITGTQNKPSKIKNPPTSGAARR